ncbi:MAG: glycosyltransferase family 1 protein [Oscillospiraceae bacterium]|nr:glycosyltransferase family 1 protein [Oscillospiraceae bacterium]
MSDKIRVLHLVGAMNCGGQETFIMNVMRHINREKIQFDFLEYGTEDFYFNQEIKALGGTVYRVTAKSKNPFLNIWQTLRLFSREKFDVVHIPSYEATCFVNLLLAKLCGIKMRIVHCHSTLGTGKTTNKLFRPLMNGLATHRFACSGVAGESLFGTAPFEIIYNAIDAQQFAYNPAVRQEMRTRLQLQEHFAVCHIGRFSPPKNHSFLLDIFAEILKKQPNAILLLVGDDKELPEVRHKAQQLLLTPHIRFLGVCSNTAQILQAADAFVFPSLFEGLGIALIEAQASGLACFASTEVPLAADVTGTVTYLPLAENAAHWAKTILAAAPAKRISHVDDLRDAGYDITALADHLGNIYAESRL